jgi:hypothetical protein
MEDPKRPHRELAPKINGASTLALVRQQAVERSSVSESAIDNRNGAVGLLSADPAPVLGIELHLARPGSREASLDEMLELSDESGNASWLSLRCLYCIAEGPFALRGAAQEKGRRCLSTSDEEWRLSLGRPLTRHLRWDPFAPCQ